MTSLLSGIGEGIKVRYVFATIDCYPGGMSDAPLDSPNLPEITQTFILRLTWDECSGNWRILLKPIHGEGARLFSDIESTLVYLEATMRTQRQ